jgi:radical SAM superfamily enzyme YgiQ (UPF0313 family)
MIFINSSPGNTLKIFQPFLPVFVPIGIGYLMAVLKHQGVMSYLVDEQLERHPKERVRELLRLTGPPYIFGFSVLSASFGKALDLAAELKEEYPDSIIIFGGIHPTAMPDEVLSYKQVDLCVRGEAEKIIVDLYHALKNFQEYRHLPGISYRTPEGNVHNERPSVVEDLDSLPDFPYEEFTNPGYDQGFVISSRGCPYNCFFCSNKISSMRRFRYRSPAAVVRDIELLHKKYKRRYVYFVDDNLTANESRVFALAAAIRESSVFNKVIFNYQARGDNSSDEVLKALYEAGFRGVYMGIETASETLMQRINKGESVAQVADAIQRAKKAGFHVSGNFIFGLPGETHRDRVDAMKLTSRLQLDLVKYNNATPYPGTELYEWAKENQYLNIQGIYENLNSVATFIENPFRKIPLAFMPPGISEKQLRIDILYGYFRFYMHPRRLRGVFTRPDLNNAWFDFGHNFRDFLRKLPAILLLLGILSFKFSSMLIRYPFYSLRNCKR